MTLVPNSQTPPAASWTTPELYSSPADSSRALKPHLDDAVEIRVLKGLGDPVARIRTATVLLGQIEAFREEVAKVRLAAVAELRAAGWSYNRIARAAGLSKSRIAQLSRAADGR
ncbi:hypothetical protein GCM10028801_45490 [Nocardioides maradonensis]